MSKTPPEQSAGYVPPSNPEAEQSVLGAILVRPEVMDEVSEILDPVDFYREAHGKIFTAMLGLYNNTDPVDLVTVCARLREANWLEGCGGPAFLAGLSEEVGFATNAVFYAKIIKKMSQLRKLLDASQQIAAACLAPVADIDAFLGQAEQRIYEIAEGQQSITVHSLDELVPEEASRIEKLFEHKQEILGVPSGFADLDYITGGWQNSDLIILAARPSMGKTALALNMGYNAAKAHGVPTLFVSLEQPNEQVVQRLISNAGPIHSTRLRSAKMIGQEWVTFGVACGKLMDIPFYLVDKPAMTVMEIRAQARRLKTRNSLGLIIVDYLQLARGSKPKSREQEVGEISRGLKSLAKELQVPVIALCQLNRDVEKRPSKKPMLVDLRESGSIEQDADLVMFIYRDELYRENSPDRGTAEITVAKHRNGPTGKLKLTYLAEYMQFQNYIGGAE
ncbi:Replicative DNA helicase DnaB [Desulfarculales bacterium]